MSLDNESRKAMIAYRQEKADIAIEDAVFLANASRCHWQANVGDFDCRCDNGVIVPSFTPAGHPIHKFTKK